MLHCVYDNPGEPRKYEGCYTKLLLCIACTISAHGKGLIPQEAASSYSLRGDVAICAEASSGPSAQLRRRLFELEYFGSTVMSLHIGLG